MKNNYIYSGPDKSVTYNKNVEAADFNIVKETNVNVKINFLAKSSTFQDQLHILDLDKPVLLLIWFTLRSPHMHLIEAAIGSRFMTLLHRFW